MATFESSLKSKLIYVFAINDERHRETGTCPFYACLMAAIC